MPKPFPREFRAHVVRVARSREPGQTLKQVASDFGISDSCLVNWLSAADREDGRKPGPTVSELVELREAKKRIRLLEQENEVLGTAPRGGLSVAGEPAGKMIYPLVRDRARAT